jgi:hypothetical protein
VCVCGPLRFNPRQPCPRWRVVACSVWSSTVQPSSASSTMACSGVQCVFLYCSTLVSLDHINTRQSRPQWSVVACSVWSSTVQHSSASTTMACSGVQCVVLYGSTLVSLLLFISLVEGEGWRPSPVHQPFSISPSPPESPLHQPRVTLQSPPD